MRLAVRRDVNTPLTRCAELCFLASCLLSAHQLWLCAALNLGRWKCGAVWDESKIPSVC